MKLGNSTGEMEKLCPSKITVNCSANIDATIVKLRSACVKDTSSPQWDHWSRGFIHS